MPLPSHAFGLETDLQRRVDLASTSWNDDASKRLLQDITRHVDHLNAQIADLSTRLQELSAPDPSEPASKKRKLPQTTVPVTNGASGGIQAPLLAQIKDTSFTVPIRKKCTLDIYGSAEGNGGVRVVNPSNGDTEAEMLFSDIEQITVTPLPERATLTYIYCLLPRSSTPLNPPNAIVFSATPTVPPSSSLDITSPAIATNLSSYTNFAPLLNDLFNAGLEPHRKKVTDPDPDDFASNIVQAHRKNEKSWCTKAFKGSKEGFLYPLSPGLLFGFKKPVLYLPFSAIESVSYTNVLQRTFNLVVSVVNEDGSTEDAEFSMLDQADFAPVDAWVKRHGLDDKSLAAGRRAKVYGVNKPKGERGVEGQEEEGEENAETGLAKAEQELQDAEDDEEDFDPGSEGDSDGSGSDSEVEEVDGEGEVEEVEGLDEEEEDEDTDALE